MTVKKGQVLQKPGEYNTKVYIVKKGLLRSYTIDSKGKEHIFLFGPEGWIIAEYIAPELCCEMFIDALEESEVVVLEKNEDVLDPKKVFKRLHALQSRILMLMSASAIDRYEYFVDTYPEIVRRVSQKMIASYLGLTPEALSKVKGERRKEKF